jgi:acetyl-CoA carboxylase biotin carboxyl carrier protein
MAAGQCRRTRAAHAGVSKFETIAFIFRERHSGQQHASRQENGLARGRGPAPVGLSYKEVAELLKIIDASQCEEVVLELDDIRLVVRRGRSGAGPSGAAATPSPTAAPAATPAPAPVATRSASTTAGKVASSPQRVAGTADRIEVRAPMVGTFYRRPSPQEPPFVEIGSTVKRGEALCLIEVMKLYTTIEAMRDGVVAEIVPEDGELVEFDQLLMVLTPA